MAILNGSWVVVEGRGVGKVEMYNFMQNFSLVRFKKQGVASMVRKESMTLIDPAFDVLLTSVNK
jgi:hypothetical protein